jgi:hypothetical protein
VKSAAPTTLKLAIKSTPRIIASSRKPCDQLLKVPLEASRE